MAPRPRPPRRPPRSPPRSGRPSLRRGSPAPHPIAVVLHRAVGEGELPAEGPEAALRALARGAHLGALSGRPRREDVVDAAQGALAVGRPAWCARDGDDHGLTDAMAARDRADCREVVRAPEHDELAVVVPGVHIEGVLLTRVEAGHRRVALASADPARGGAGRPLGEPDL